MKQFNNNSNLEVTYVPISELKSAEYNPRKWSDKEISHLRESVQKFGMVDPILVNSAKERMNIVIGGHFRLKVARDLGIKEVPVAYINIPDLDQEKELNLRLNRNHGEWEWDILKEFDTELLLNVGFDDNDLSSIWDDVLEIEDNNFNVEEELEKIVEEEITVKEGEIYQLGNHKLICGDSTDIEVVKKLVGDTKINMIYCDPIYNIGLSYDKGIGGKKNYGGKVNDSKTEAEYKAFLKQTMENALTVSEKDCHCFYWCDENYIGLIQSLYKEVGLNNKRVCLWIKDNQNPTPQIAFNKVYESCVYSTRGKPYLDPRTKNLNEILNKEVGTGNRALEDVLDIINIWLEKRLPSTQYQHSTQKPISLHERPLRRCTKIGDNVLDLFGGSGSTMLACDQMKRKAFLVEIEPIFCQLIIKRYEQNTNNKAFKLN